ncbi:hypothetical protein D9M69_216740 [compost metagenome]
MQELAGVDGDSLGLGDGVAEIRVIAGEAEGAVAGDGPGLAVEGIGRDVQATFARVLDGALAVVQGSGCHLHVTACGQGALGAVVQQVVHADGERGFARRSDGAALVDQAARLHLGVAGSDELAAGVIELAGDLYLTVGGARGADFAVAVGQRAGLQNQGAITGDGAAVVVQTAPGGHAQKIGTGRDKRASGVQEFAGVDRDAPGLGSGFGQVRVVAGEAEGAVAGDGAGLTVERIGGDIQAAVAGVLDGALAVVEGRRGYLHVAAGGQGALGAVVEQAVHADSERGVARRSDGAALVEQAARLHRGVSGSHQLATCVVELTGDVHLGVVGASGADLAFTVGERAGLEVQRPIAGDGAGVVVQPITGVHAQQVGTRGDQGAAGVQEFAGVDRDALGLGSGAGQVGLIAGEAEGAVAGNGAGLTVEGVGGDVQGAFARVLDGALAVVQRGGGHLHVAACGQGALGAVVQQAVHADGERGVTRSSDGSALVEQAARLHRGVSGSHQLAAGVVELTGDVHLGVVGAGGADFAFTVGE